MSEGGRAVSQMVDDMPQSIVVDKNGAYWRYYDDVYGTGPGYSMCPVSEDNEPLDVAAVYVPQRPGLLTARHLEAALDLLVKHDIHGGLPNGYCAVCQGQCLLALAAIP